MPIKAYYNAAVSDFLNDDDDRILGILTVEHHYTWRNNNAGLGFNRS